MSFCAVFLLSYMFVSNRHNIIIYIYREGQFIVTECRTVPESGECETGMSL